MFDALKGLVGGTKKPEPEEEKGPLAIRFPFEHVMVPGVQALARREELARSFGITAVILGPPDDFGLILDVMNDEPNSVADILEESRSVDIDPWREANEREQPDHYTAPSADWPADHQVAPIQLTAHFDSDTKQPAREVVIGLLPTANA